MRSDGLSDRRASFGSKCAQPSACQPQRTVFNVAANAMTLADGRAAIRTGSKRLAHEYLVTHTSANALLARISYRKGHLLTLNLQRPEHYTPPEAA
jgi:hypothetical protein